MRVLCYGSTELMQADHLLSKKRATVRVLKKRLPGTLALPISESTCNLKPHLSALKYTRASYCVAIGPELFTESLRHCQRPRRLFLKVVFLKNLTIILNLLI